MRKERKLFRFAACGLRKGVRSNPVQWIMLVNEFVIPVVLQKIHAMLNDRGGDQTVNGISDGDAFAPQFAVNRRAKLERRPVVFQISQILKLPFDGNEFLLIADALQNFKQHETAVTNFIVILKALLKFDGLHRFTPVEKVNAHG